MKSHKKNVVQALLCFLCLGFAVSCSEKPKPLSEILPWIIGEWYWPRDNGMFYESWQASGDSLIGRSWTLSGTDTVMVENLSIAKRNEEIFYSISLKIGKKKTRHLLKASEIGDTKVVFENTIDEYPDQLVYELVNEKEMTATLSDIEGESEVYQMRKK